MTDPASLNTLLSDRYTLLREIGAGGMATVFLARDIKHDREVALKVLRPELAAILGAERFLAEIKITARLDHPHILTLIDSGAANSFLYYVLPYVRGESLRAKLTRERQLPVDEAVAITRQVASALDYAHRRGIIHRDIKPENILLHEGEAILTDFGIALAVAEAGGTRLTESGLALGTPHYMSPEQATGDTTLDARSDIYSLASVLYEMLTGDPPITGRNRQAMIARLLTERPTRVRAIRDAVPEPIESAVSKALAKTPADRYATTTDFVNALAVGGGPAGAVSAARRRRRVPALAWGSALIALLLGAGVLSWEMRRSRNTPPDRSLTVMPFANLSSERTNDYFGEGLAEEMTNALSRAGLRVIGRASARGLAARGLDAEAIARQLGVGGVVEGTVQRSGDRVRITASLASARDGAVLWSQTYDRELKDVFAVQDEIARGIAGELRTTIMAGAGAPLARTETADPEAHALYLQGLYLWNRRTAPTLRSAIHFFEEAANRDPSYARALAGIALSYAVLPVYSDGSADSMRAKAIEAAGRALAIDSTLPEAHAALAWANFSSWRFAQADAEFTKAISLDSTFATARFWNALRLFHSGHGDEASRELTRARELEPASLVINTGFLQLDYARRRYELADSEAQRVLAIDPGFPIALVGLARTKIEEGRGDTAIAILTHFPQPVGVRPSEVSGSLAYAYARTGQPTEARRMLAQIAAANGGQYPSTGIVAAALDLAGEHDQASQVMTRAILEHDGNLNWANRSAPFDRLRRYPELKQLFATMDGS
jgi:serine/threonine-protein kinase